MMAKSGGMLNAICAKLRKTPATSENETTETNTTDDYQNDFETSQNDLDFETDKENNNKPLLLSKHKEPSPVNHDGGRKNKRKSGKPRNITQFKVQHEESFDELEEYEVNNKGVDFDEIFKDGENEAEEEEEEEEDYVLDLSRPNESDSQVDHSFDLSNRESTQNDDTFSHDESEILDLTVNKSNSSDNHCHDHPDEDSDEMNTSSHLPTPVRPAPPRPPPFSHPSPHAHSHINGQNAAPEPTDADAIKDFAQSTMSELLGMYGLSAEVESITKKVPLKNFASGSILSRNQNALPKPKLFVSNIPNVYPLALSNKEDTSPFLSSVANTPGQPRPSPAPSVSSTQASSSITANQQLYAKYVTMNNINKLAAAAQGGVVGGSAVLRPGAMRDLLSTPSPALAMPYPGAPASLPGSLGTAQPFSSPLSEGKSLSGSAKFASSSEYIKACFNPTLGTKLGSQSSLSGKTLLPDYGRYMTRYSSGQECGQDQCQNMTYRDHYHCVDCSYKVFIKKEEMVRHFKWHKKRDESLQHGFMRYSPVDDCSENFGPCTHNGRQTHYHCIQAGCNKVYISTSDVQMHANYHRKDSAIISEGFQRFRATEDCGTPSCAFYGQRTTHFHCRRSECKFTFKNKADMEKHKTYHQKDEILSRDGFKKFMKYEHCNYASCRYSKVANHIHCIRPGCDYVLHSTGQLYSHKRKHERRDLESTYHGFKTEPKPTSTSADSSPQIMPKLIAPLVGKPPMNTAGLNSSVTTIPPQTVLARTPNAPIMIAPIKSEAEYIDLEDFSRLQRSEAENHNASNDVIDVDTSQMSPHILGNATITTTPSMTVEVQNDCNDTSRLSSSLANSSMSGSDLDDSLSLPIPKDEDAGSNMAAFMGSKLAVTTPALHGGIPSDIKFVPKSSPAVNEKPEKDESWKKYLTRYTANDPCHPRCNFLYKDHYHCNKGCGMIFKAKDGVREHARYHTQQDYICQLSYRTFEEKQDCGDVNCQKKLKTKHFHCVWPDCRMVISVEDPPFSRLEHHKIHEYARIASSKMPTTSSPFTYTENIKRRRGRPPKYPKTEIPVVPKITMTDLEITQVLAADSTGAQRTLLCGFKRIPGDEPCPDEQCMFFMKEHFHCVRARCHHATDRADVLNLHAKDFHSYITILEGFEFFERNVNCRRQHCHNRNINKHFHCLKPRCDYSFIRYSTMAQHDRKHKQADIAKLNKPALTAPIVNPASLALATTFAPSIITGQVTGLNAATSSPLMVTDPDALIKTKGTYFPMNSLHPSTASMLGALDFSQTAVSQPALVSHIANPLPAPVASGVVSSSSSSLINIAPKPSPMAFPSETPGPGLPLTMLLQQKSSTTVPPLNWLTMKMKMHYGMHQNCGRPFCKLKKRDHYHCYDCNQAFSDPIRLKNHVSKHGLRMDKAENVHGLPLSKVANGNLVMSPSKISGDEGNSSPHNECSDRVMESSHSPFMATSDSDNSHDDNNYASSSLNLNPTTFTNILKGSQNFGQDSSGSAAMDLSVAPASAPAAERSDEEEDSMPGIAEEGVETEDNHGLSLNGEDETDSEDEDGQSPLKIDLMRQISEPQSDAQYQDQVSVSNADQRYGIGTSVNNSAVLKGQDLMTTFKSHEDNSNILGTSLPPHIAASLNLMPGQMNHLNKNNLKYSQTETGQEKKYMNSALLLGQGQIPGQIISGTSAGLTQIRGSNSMFTQGMNSAMTFSPDEGLPSATPSLNSSLYGSTPPCDNQSFSRNSGRKRGAPRHDGFINTNDAVVPKQPRLLMARPMKDDNVPEGYTKYSYMDDCQYERCAYRLSSAHYHCVRDDCGHSFGDRSRAQQHTLKHKRIDCILGEDFHQWPIHSVCGYVTCEFSNRAKHYHCIRCEFCCSETSKIEPHRKHHQRMDDISAKGFEKFSLGVNCNIEGCGSAVRQTHYHCTRPDCRQAVSGPAGMLAHQMKHLA